jgi:hypothetical protein
MVHLHIGIDWICMARVRASCAQLVLVLAGYHNSVQSPTTGDLELTAAVYVPSVRDAIGRILMKRFMRSMMEFCKDMLTPPSSIYCYPAFPSL